MTARIAFLGDILLGGDAQPVLDEKGYDHALAGIADLWADADLVVANHEAPLTERTQPAYKPSDEHKRYWYKADPGSACALAARGIRVVSLANNHVGDFGPAGVLDTMAALDATGIAHCGAGPDDDAARRPVTVQVGQVKVGFLSVMQRYDAYMAEDVYARDGHPGPALLHLPHLAVDLARLRAQVDLSVVLVHWGRNYRPVTSLQRRLAQEIRAAGADLVVGHHPHVAQPVDLSGGAPVLYSLGNAAFGTIGRFHADRPPYGVVALVEMDRRHVVDVELRLIKVDNTVVRYQPQPADAPADRAFLQTLYEQEDAAASET